MKKKEKISRKYFGEIALALVCILNSILYLQIQSKNQTPGQLVFVDVFFFNMIIYVRALFPWVQTTEHGFTTSKPHWKRR